MLIVSLLGKWKLLFLSKVNHYTGFSTQNPLQKKKKNLKYKLLKNNQLFSMEK